MSETGLKRAISLPLLVAYGVGTMVGGGFYALLGRMAHHAGMSDHGMGPRFLATIH